MLSIGPHLHEAHSTVDLLTALFAQCQKAVPARLKPQRPAQGYTPRTAGGRTCTRAGAHEPRPDRSALAPDLPNVDYSPLNCTRDVLLHGSEVAYEVNSRWPRLLLHMQYELNGSSLLPVSAYRAVLGDQLTALLRAQGGLTT